MSCRVRGAWPSWVCCVAMAMPVAGAADGAGVSYGAVDPGQVECRLLIDMHERAPQGTAQQFHAYMVGYRAGLQAGAAMPALPMDRHDRARDIGRLLDHCRSRPATTVGAAVRDLHPPPAR